MSKSPFASKARVATVVNLTLPSPATSKRNTGCEINAIHQSCGE